jgi:hypothetical protein
MVYVIVCWQSDDWASVSVSRTPHGLRARRVRAGWYLAVGDGEGLDRERLRLRRI